MADELDPKTPEAEEPDTPTEGALTDSDSAATDANSGATGSPGDKTERLAPVKRNRSKAPVRKSRPTAKQSNRKPKVEDKFKAKNPAHFARQSVAELKKVVWPTAESTRGYFVLVVAFVVFIMAYVSILDVAFGWGLLKIFG